MHRKTPAVRLLSSAALILTQLLLVACGTAQPAAQEAPAPSSRFAGVDAGLIEDLVIANRLLALEGIFDAKGHVSVRHPATPERFLMSRSLAPELVTADDIMEYDMEGNLIDARGRTPYKERFIHSEIYKARRDVNSVVHNHSPAAIPFGVSSVPLRAMSHSGAFLYDGVPVFDFRDAAGMTDMLVSDAKLGAALATTLGRKDALLMRGHGVVTTGPELYDAVGRSIYLEVNARLQAEAIALGGEITYFSPEEARLVEERRDYVRAWEAWKRKVLTTVDLSSAGTDSH